MRAVVVDEDLGRLVVSVARAAWLLDVTDRYVEMLISRGELPSLKLGRRRLIRVDDLRSLVEGRMGEP